MTDQQEIEEPLDSRSEAEAATYRDFNERLDAMDEAIVRIENALERILQRGKAAGLVVDSSVN